jgi:arabinan endo-1,5-alpha-L-arabinosidase
LKKLLTIFFVAVCAQLLAQQPPVVADTGRRRFTPPPVGTITPTRQTPAHDPVMIKQGDTYFLFTTGFGIGVFSSKDMKSWRRERPVFSKPPEWVIKALPNYKGGSMWAPDISYHNGKYYLYYAVSSFGKNTSCIGLVVNKTLDSASAGYKWEDMGKVVQSVPGRDMWNAIDPNLIVDENNTPWLAFGSFWNGMKMVKLSSDFASVAQPEEWYTIASRPRSFAIPDTAAGDGSIEGPFVFKKDKYYYLFISWDYCCRAEKSDYKVVVGRSEKVTGPYIDKNGVPLWKNGGSLVIQGDNKQWYGAGHNSVYTFDNKDYIVYHGYDAQDKGRSKLIIEELQWKDGWPAAPSQQPTQ